MTTEVLPPFSNNNYIKNKINNNNKIHTQIHKYTKDTKMVKTRSGLDTDVIQPHKKPRSVLRKLREVGCEVEIIKRRTYTHHKLGWTTYTQFQLLMTMNEWAPEIKPRKTYPA